MGSNAKDWLNNALIPIGLVGMKWWLGLIGGGVPTYLLSPSPSDSYLNKKQNKTSKANFVTRKAWNSFAMSKSQSRDLNLSR